MPKGGGWKEVGTTASSGHKRQNRQLGAAPPKPIKVSDAEVKQIAKSVQTMARRLLSFQEPLRTSLFQPLTDFLRDAASERTQTIRVVGLGIGVFDRSRDHRTGFLQMALLLAIRQHVTAALKKHATAARASVHTSYFDPVAQQPQKRCCKELQVGVESQNKHGAYRAATEEGEVLILFMPRCPWAMVSNSVVANWPSRDPGATGETDALPMRGVLWVGNDLREAPDDTLVCADARLTQLFSFHSIDWDEAKPLTTGRAGSNAAGNSDNGGEGDSEDDGEAHGLGEASNALKASYGDMKYAFHGLATYTINSSFSSAKVTSALHSISTAPPAIIKKALELR